MSSVRRGVRGTAVAIAVMAVLTVVMIPLRSHLSVATDGLILIIPVVAGVVSGGFGAGVECSRPLTTHPGSVRRRTG
jgi:hypothetical protein